MTISFSCFLTAQFQFLKVNKRQVIIYGGVREGVAPKKNFFPSKHFADPTIKKSKIFLPNLKYCADSS
jgi:hypothetical protein